MLGGSAESEDFAETLADKEEYQEMPENNITQRYDRICTCSHSHSSVAFGTE